MDLQGMDFTTDKLRSLVRKWQSLIEAHVDVKTTDSYTLRLFCIAFTKKRANQQKRTCYAQSSQIRQVNTWILKELFAVKMTCMFKILGIINFLLVAFCFIAARSAGRCVRSWWTNHSLVISRNWFWNSFPSRLAKRLRRQHQVSTLCRMCSSGRLRSWNLPNLTLESWWR